MVLTPNIRHRSEPAKETQMHIQKYVGAHSYALDSAQYGFTAAEEGLALTKRTNLSKDDPSELAEYIAGMIRISKKGEERSKAALDEFRSVKRGIIQVGRDFLPHLRYLIQAQSRIHQEDVDSDQASGKASGEYKGKR